MNLANVLNDRNDNHALLSLVAGAVMISFSGVWVKVSHVTPTASAFYRVFFGAIFLLVAAFLRGEVKWYGRRHMALGLLCGFFFALDLCFFHYSVRYVGPGLGTIIPNFQVFILTGIGVLFLGERLRLLFVIAVPLALLGLFLVVGIDWRNLGRLYKIGVYFGLAAAACYAAFLLSLRKLQSEQIGVSIFYVLMMVSVTTSVYIALEMLRADDTFKIPDLQSFLAMLALGLFSQTMGWILITNALPKVRTSLSGLILLLQPSLAFVWDVLFFDRPMRLINWLGVLMVLVAIYAGASGTAPPASKE